MYLCTVLFLWHFLRRPLALQQDRERLEAALTSASQQAQASEARILKACELRLAEKVQEVAVLKAKVEKLEAEGAKVRLTWLLLAMAAWLHGCMTA